MALQCHFTIRYFRVKIRSTQSIMMNRVALDQDAHMPKKEGSMK